MNTENPMDEILRNVGSRQPRLELRARLQADLSEAKIQPRPSRIREWFAPTGHGVSYRRIALAAAIAIACLMPITYGTAKIIKAKFFPVEEYSYTYEEETTDKTEDGAIKKTVKTHTYGVKSVVGGDGIESEVEAKKKVAEFAELYRQGKARQIKPNVWQVTLSNGEEFAMGTQHPELIGMDPAEKEKILKKQFDEIDQLRREGKYEKTYLKDIEINGKMAPFYEYRYTLSNGKVITLGGADEPDSHSGQNDAH